MIANGSFGIINSHAKNPGNTPGDIFINGLGDTPISRRGKFSTSSASISARRNTVIARGSSDLEIVTESSDYRKKNSMMRHRSSMNIYNQDGVTGRLGLMAKSCKAGFTPKGNQQLTHN
jgi:hypothetical protein